MASEIPEIVYAFGPQLNAFMAIGILPKCFRGKCSSLSGDGAEFRYVPLYSFAAPFTRTAHYSNLNFTYEED